MITPDPVEIVPDTTVLVAEIQQLAKIETASFILKNKKFYSTRDNDRFWGILGENLELIASCKVTAGIDLSNITDDNFEILNNQTIKIKLPKAKIFDVIITASSVPSRTKGILATVDKDMESNTKDYAQNYFLEQALNSDLLDQANQNAQNRIKNLAKKFKFTTVVFTQI